MVVVRVCGGVGWGWGGGRVEILSYLELWLRGTVCICMFA